MKRGKEPNSYMRTPSKTFVSEIETASTKPPSCTSARPYAASPRRRAEEKHRDFARRAQISEFRPRAVLTLHLAAQLHTQAEVKSPRARPLLVIRGRRLPARPPPQLLLRRGLRLKKNLHFKEPSQAQARSIRFHRRLSHRNRRPRGTAHAKASPA